MNLEAPLLDSFFRLQNPEAPPGERSAAKEAFLSALREGRKSFADVFVMLDGEEVAWSYSLLRVQEGCYYALPPRGPRARRLDPEGFSVLLRELSSRAEALGARSLHLRLPLGPGHAELAGALSAACFIRKHERIEFRAPVGELPLEGESPFAWEAVSESGPLTLSRAAELLGRAGEGDPDWDPGDRPEELLKGYLADDQLYGGLDAVEVGFIGGQPAAVVIAQVNPRTGWSRITYMGLLRAFRGKGLGRPLHRRGFELMRRQGGKEYHGGTVDANAAMIGLFRAHGCREYRRIEEWSKMLEWPVLDLPLKAE